ncbi:MAG: ATP-binding protein [Candidatus Saccharibacteria bacterium]|nr:ATP-binding protein [Candidatus Saccharibacteria bacterium]
MEALTLSSPMVIEVVGLPGAGKSFFASQFADTFGAAMVSCDKIRWTLFANHTYSDTENSIVDQVADMMITELLRTRKTFVLDGGYNTNAARKAMLARAHKNGFRVLTIVVQTDEPTSKRRATKRSDKKVGDQYKQSMTNEQFELACQQYEEPQTSQDDVVVISGKHTYNTQAKTVLRRMVETGKQPTEPTKIKVTAQSATTLNIKPRGPFIG